MASEGRSRRRRSRRREAQAQRTPRIQHCQPSVAQTTIRQPQRGYSRSLNRFATAGEPVRTCDQADASGNPAHLERLTHFRRQPSTVELHVPRHLGVPCTELPPATSLLCTGMVSTSITMASTMHWALGFGSGASIGGLLYNKVQTARRCSSPLWSMFSVLCNRL